MKRKDWGLLGLALITVVATMWAFDRQSPQYPSHTASESLAGVSFKPAAKEPPPLAPMEAAIAGLEENARPWRMAVLGDSTGNEESEWVHLLAMALAEETGRPAEIHTWSIDTLSYDKTTRYPGQGEVITVWNGSAAGKNTGYSMEHRQAMIPERPDLLIINHGHNQEDARVTSKDVRSMAHWARTVWSEPPALAVTLQNPRTDARADEHAHVIRQLREEVPTLGAVSTIDVFSAFAQSGDVATLLRSDGFHPSDAGQALWADVAWKSFEVEKVLQGQM